MPIKYDSQRRAVARYNRENYDIISLRVPKGQRDVIKEFAKSRGETVNSFLIRIIKEAMEKNN